MKKFGKIFGISMLTVATLTAGVIGLAGCGDKKAPEEPVVDEPVTEDVTMQDVLDYANSEGVISSFDGFLVTLALPFEDENGETVITNNEVRIIKVGETFNAKVITEEPGLGVINKYYTGDGALYNEVIPEDEGQEVQKLKITHPDSVAMACEESEEMFNTYSSVTGIINNLTDGLGNITFTPTKTTNGNNVTFTVQILNIMNEPDYVIGGDGTTDVEVKYTGAIVFCFVDGELQSISMDLTRSVEGSDYSEKQEFEIVEISEIEFPTDLDTYVEVNDEP